MTDRLTDALAEALVSAQDRLHALQSLLHVHTGSLEPADVMRRVLAEALGLTASDAAVFAEPGGILAVGDGAPAGFAARVAAAAGEDAARPTCTAGGCGVVVSLAGPEPVALGFARSGGPAYSTGDVQLVEAVLAVARRLRELARLHREEIRRATIEQEHRLASVLAQAVLPAAPPLLPGVELFARSEPAALAGGDFITFAVRGGELRFAAGDVSGKGLPAAIVMTRTVGAIRAAFLTCDDPAAAMRAIDSELYDHLDQAGVFVTTALGFYAPGDGVVRLCNAGHSPVLSVTGGTAVPVPPSIPPVGVDRAAGARTVAVPMPPGATVILGSDGLTEQPGPGGELFGYDRFTRCCLSGRDQPVRRLGERLLELVRAHAAGTAQADDRTLVLVRAPG